MSRRKKIRLSLYVTLFVALLIPLRLIYITMIQFRSKEMCSCLFVSEQTPEYCLQRIKKSYPVFHPIDIDEQQKSVTIDFILHAKAQFQNDRTGCLLL